MPAYDEQLLVVLAAEDGDARPGDGEELRDDGGDALEVARALLAFERRRDGPGANARVVAGRVHRLAASGAKTTSAPAPASLRVSPSRSRG